MTKTHWIPDSPNGPLSPLQRKFEAPAAFLEVLYNLPDDQEEPHSSPLTSPSRNYGHQAAAVNAKVCRFRSQDMDAPPSEFTLWPQVHPRAPSTTTPDLRIPSPRGPQDSQAGQLSLSPPAATQTRPLARRAPSSRIFCDLCIFQTTWPSVKSIVNIPKICVRKYNCLIYIYTQTYI